jgi:hypothetical protein
MVSLIVDSPLGYGCDVSKTLSLIKSVPSERKTYVFSSNEIDLAAASAPSPT